jgi:hypothetical protein
MRRPLTRIGFALAAFIAAIVAAAGLPGCQQLFTTSLAESLARDKVTLPDTLTTTQATDLAAEAKANDDTKLATAVVDTLVAQVTDPAAQTELAAAAASSAVTASGASAAVMDAFNTAMESGDMTSIDTAALLAAIQAGATDNVVEALTYLDPATGIADPAALTGTDLGATDYLIAAVVIASSALPAGADPENLTPAELTAFQATPEYAAAVNILGEATALVDPGSPSADLLSQFSGMFSI